MLVLSRKCDQSLIIGGNIRITVLKTSGDVVRLGIEAPRNVVVHRSEVFERILASASPAEFGRKPEAA